MINGNLISLLFFINENFITILFLILESVLYNIRDFD